MYILYMNVCVSILNHIYIYINTYTPPSSVYIAILSCQPGRRITMPQNVHDIQPSMLLSEYEKMRGVIFGGSRGWLGAKLAVKGVYICMYIYVYMYACICIYMYVYLYTYVCMCVYINIYIYIYTYIYRCTWLWSTGCCYLEGKYTPREAS
jgi:hypothetical protein